jgi:predicted nucleotidyltransferase
MGISHKTVARDSVVPFGTTSLADARFTRTQQRVLALLFGQPGRSFCATELIGLAGAGSGAVQRELARLSASGLVMLRLVGNQKHCQANPDAPVFAELCSVVRKTVGLFEPLRAALAPLAARIEAAFIYGSVAKGEDTVVSDIDLLVVAEGVDYAEVYAALEPLHAALGRPVNPTVLTRQDMVRKVQRKESFITRVMAQPRIWVMGGEGDLGS